MELKAGQKISWKEYEWIVLDPDYNGGVLLLMANIWKRIPFNKEKNDANWAASTIRQVLIDELLPKLGEENLMDHETDMVSDDGDDFLGTITDKVFILSADEYRTYRRRKVMPLYDHWWWLCTPWWIEHSKRNPYAGGAYDPRVVYSDGSMSGHYGAIISGGCVPACIVKSGIL